MPPGERNATFVLPHGDRVYVLGQAFIVWQGAPERSAGEAGARCL
jgi:branched-chain amino acid transport system ATP-binding protein